MCGIVGVAGDVRADHDKVFRTLLILDTLRGEDSTGILTVGKFDEAVSVVKAVGSPFELFNDRRYDKAVAKSNKLLLGHNRYATSGAITRSTAHPFEMETLVGVHNGTLSNKCRLLDPGKFSVDSENLYHHIEQKGLEDAINTAEGSWALVWWNKDDSTLNFLRNKERTLYLCRSVDHKTMFWASEGWMLDIALNRHGVKYEEPFLLEDDLLHTIVIGDRGDMGKPVVRRMAKKTIVEQAVSQVKKLVVVKNTAPKDVIDNSYLQKKGVVLETLGEADDEDKQKYIICLDPLNPTLKIRWYPRVDCEVAKFVGEEVIGDISGARYADEKLHYKISPWTVALRGPQSNKNAVNDVTDVYSDHKGRLLTKKAWADRYSYCSWCHGNIDPDEPDNVLTSGGDCFCPDCKDLPVVTEFTKPAKRA